MAFEDMNADGVELSDEQIVRVDEIENAAFDFCKILTEKDDLKWDMSFIGEIADRAAEILTHHGYKIRYPAIVEDPGIGEHVEEYFS